MEWHPAGAQPDHDGLSKSDADEGNGSDPVAGVKQDYKK